MFIRLCLLILALALPLSWSQQELWDTPQGRSRIFDALVDTFEENYWDEDYRDWQAWGDAFRDDALSTESREDFDAVLRRMVNDLQDNHSRWVGQPNSFSLNGAFEDPKRLGLGFQHRYLSNTGIVIERVYPDTPAAAAGLQRGDVITSINGQDLTKSMASNRLLTDAVESGEVKLDVSRKKSRLRLDLTPEAIHFDSLSSQPQSSMLDETTGYIYLPSFEGGSVGQDMHDLIRQLESEGAEALVLDLRDNPGGRLGELGLVLGAFIEGEWAEAIDEGEVTWRARYRRSEDQGINALVEPDGRVIASERVENAVAFNGSLAVLVTRQNSSAGEIGPLVLQNFGRAIIVGEATEGNVEAIRTFDLPDGSLVYVAIANLQSIDGSDFSVGLEPDVRVSDSSLADLARGFDAPVAEALKALKDLPFTPGKFF